MTALLSLVVARSSASTTVLADLSGDLPAALGIPEPSGPGLGDWLGASPDVGVDALARLEVEVGRSLRLLPRGALPGVASSGSRAELLANWMAADGRVVVADCGAADRTPALELAAGATISLVVVRPCYLALRRVLAAPVRATGVVLVDEPERALRRRDVEDVLGLPVWAEVPRDPAVARAVDAGLLAGRVPRTAERSLERAVLAVAS
ncbi:MAG: hypothetical protein ABR540_07905 [Acidimicrobiales bacterium]|nr:hypothetical protein [Actinomycetota bacterium]